MDPLFSLGGGLISLGEMDPLFCLGGGLISLGEVSFQDVDRTEYKYETFKRKEILNKLQLNERLISCFNYCEEKVQKALVALNIQHLTQTASKACILYATMSAMEHLKMVIPKKLFPLYDCIFVGVSAFGLYLIAIEAINTIASELRPMLPDWLISYIMTYRGELTRRVSDTCMKKKLDSVLCKDIVNIHSTRRRWSSFYPQVNIQVVNQSEFELVNRRFYSKGVLDELNKLDKRSFSYFKEKARKSLEAAKYQRITRNTLKFCILFGTVTAVEHFERFLPDKELPLCQYIILGGIVYTTHLLMDTINIITSKPKSILPDWFLSYMTDHIELSRSVSEEHRKEVIEDIVNVHSTGRRWSV